LSKIAEAELAEIAPRDGIGKNEARAENDKRYATEHEERVFVVEASV
jgi:hypothetical protein